MITKIIAYISLIIAGLIVCSLPLMLLWNWLMPTIFGLIKIDIWQSLGINILAYILFRNKSFSKNDN